MNTDSRVLDLVLQEIAQDFPAHQHSLGPIFDAAAAAADGGDVRQFARVCTDFFKTHGVSWKRHELFNRYWLESAEGGAPLKNDEDDDPAYQGPSLPNYQEMGRLLAHRIICSYYMQTRRLRYLSDVSIRPFWRLASDICPYASHRKLDGFTDHYLNQFWVQRQLPGPRLDCRCRFTALTRTEAGVPIQSQEARAADHRTLLVRHLLAGDDVGYRGDHPYVDVALRKVQIIGESLKIIVTSKNQATRVSRLQVVSDVFNELRTTWAEVLPVDACHLVVNAVKRASSHSTASGLLHDAGVFSRRAERSTNQAVRSRNFKNAVLVLSSEPAELLVEDDLRRIQVELKRLLQ